MCKELTDLSLAGLEMNHTLWASSTQRVKKTTTVYALSPTRKPMSSLFASQSPPLPRSRTCARNGSQKYITIALGYHV
jgi:hypothetical protein